MNKYVCIFEKRGSKYEGNVRVNCLADVKDGFWINDKGKFTLGSDCKFWIPPSQIKIIEKIQEE
jgi:hypothetical protein